MSIGIIISVHDGVVLAADSASTLTLVGGENPHPVNFHSNTEKIVNLYKRQPIGCVPYGAGSIGNAAISSLLREFRETIMNPTETSFSISTYTVEEVVRRLASYLMGAVTGLGAAEPKPTLGVIVGGYSASEPLPEAWQISIDQGVQKDLIRLRAPGETGINWGGDGEAISRIVHGFSKDLPKVLTDAGGGDTKTLLNRLSRSLEAQLVFAPMPVQDAIELSDWLAQTAIMYSRFTPGSALTRGPVDIASITRFEGYKWIRRKHYYQKEMN
jgi:hypothetical protein